MLDASGASGAYPQLFPAWPEPSIRDLAVMKLGALSAGLGLSPKHREDAVKIFDLMSQRWAAQAAGIAPNWASDITDDGSPFEFSVALTGALPELRILVESQMFPTTPVSSWQAGLLLNERLRREAGADLTLFDAVVDLFAPVRRTFDRFSLWHAATVCPKGTAAFKIYLNPQIHGIDASFSVAEQAFHRVGLGDAWTSLRAGLPASPESTALRFFSLDLAAPSEARAKIYVGFPGADLSTINRFHRAMAGCDAMPWLQALTRSERQLGGRPILTCLAFRCGHAHPEVTVHVPIRSYVAHDQDALDRVRPLVCDRDAETIEASVKAMAGRPLEVGRGLVTYASVRHAGGSERITLYLAPEVYAIASPRRIPSESHVEARRST
jgi:DMATS type aromatic prenyltransferase